jgi:hypothetical protein
MKPGGGRMKNEAWRGVQDKGERIDGDNMMKPGENAV